jgi:hypothetical protein
VYVVGSANLSSPMSLRVQQIAFRSQLKSIELEMRIEQCVSFSWAKVMGEAPGLDGAAELV